MSFGGVLAAVSVESAKLRAQAAVRVLLAACIAGPVAFLGVVCLQTSLPEDTLFGLSMRDSGFATPLVVLGFAALWALPLVAGIAGGDLFAAEDRHRTWPTILTRSVSRVDLFAGKLLAGLGFVTLALAVLAVASTAAGLLLIGHQPLVDLSGALVPPGRALGKVALAWASALPPAFGFTAVAVLASIASRRSTAGVGLPVLAALTMQLGSMTDGPEVIRRLLLTSGFAAWHGLLNQRPYYRPLLDGAIVSGAYFVGCLASGYRLLQRRDIGG